MSDWAKQLDDYHRAMQRVRWCRSGCNQYHSLDDWPSVHFAMPVHPEPEEPRRTREKEAVVGKTPAAMSAAASRIEEAMG